MDQLSPTQYVKSSEGIVGIFKLEYPLEHNDMKTQETENTVVGDLKSPSKDLKNLVIIKFWF